MTRQSDGICTSSSVLLNAHNNNKRYTYKLSTDAKLEECLGDNNHNVFTA